MTDLETGLSTTTQGQSLLQPDASQFLKLHARQLAGTVTIVSSHRGSRIPRLPHIEATVGNLIWKAAWLLEFPGQAHSKVLVSRDSTAL